MSSPTETILARLDAAGTRGFDAYSAEYDRLDAEYGQDAIRTAVFSRRAQTTPETATIARFGTLLGAVVVLTEHPDGGHRWTCSGCPTSGIHTRTGVEQAAADANTHAATCRALPRR